MKCRFIFFRSRVYIGFRCYQCDYGTRDTICRSNHQCCRILHFILNVHVGLYLEYKYLSATTADKSSQTVKLGGTGIFAGISLAF